MKTLLFNGYVPDYADQIKEHQDEPKNLKTRTENGTTEITRNTENL